LTLTPDLCLPFARDLQNLLGYVEWRNFRNTAISKAKTACEASGHVVSDHFVDVNKTIQMPKSAEKEIEDIMLTRYACYQQSAGRRMSEGDFTDFTDFTDFNALNDFIESKRL
jgi:hypothetical protein